MTVFREARQKGLPKNHIQKNKQIRWEVITQTQKRTDFMIYEKMATRDDFVSMVGQ